MMKLRKLHPDRPGWNIWFDRSKQVWIAENDRVQLRTGDKPTLLNAIDTGNTYGVYVRRHDAQ